MAVLHPAKTLLQKSHNKMTALYQLKIALSGSKPLVWRRVMIYNTISLSELHKIIQLTMGWKDEHLWAFEFQQGNFDEKYADHILKQYVTEPKQHFYYIYDFGDHWQHKITLEKVINKGQSALPPYCISGKNACPPEDCGGIWGYAELLEALEDEAHNAHELALAQLGQNFNPNAFDLEAVNKALQPYQK